MIKSISILGSGWLGIPVAEEFISEGYCVRCSTTSQEKLAKMESKGITPFLIDITSAYDLTSEFFTSETLIVAITSKDVESFKQLVKNIEDSSINKVIFISSTSVYANTNSEVTEESVTLDSALFHIEELFRKSKKFQTTIIRFAGLFGYDRDPGNFHKPGRLIKDPEGYVNLIHRDDCIAIVKALLTQDVFGETFNACSDSHPKRRDFYLKERLRYGNVETLFNEDSNNQYKIINSEKLKNRINHSIAKFNELYFKLKGDGMT